MRLSLQRRYRSGARQAALASCVMVLTAAPVQAGASPSASPSACAERPKLTRLQQRLLDKAEEGDQALRQFVYITRAVHGLDLVTVVQWLDQRRAAAAACQAQARHAGTQASAVPP